MAHHLRASLSAAGNLIRLQPRSCFLLSVSFSNSFSSLSRVQFAAATKASGESIFNRRSANYQPSLWGYDLVQSLRSDYVGESYGERIKKLKEDVTVMLDEIMEADHPLYQLELVDTLQRLGVSYHFDQEIKRILNSIYKKNNNGGYNDKQKQESLYTVALAFRLLRQHGYDGYDLHAEETFSGFMDEKGNFKPSLTDDCKGILALYEATYLFVERESIFFHDARNFTTTYLKEYIRSGKDTYLSSLVNHALVLPLHWRMLRSEARWFIDVYERGPNPNSTLLELAKLDFNVVQATHQEDLKSVSRWWKKMGLETRLNFARDRLVENFFCTMGVIFEPQFGYCRKMLTKVNSLITAIDDMYDVYGTLDELELFTDAVNRWDVNAMEQLPDYMKICFFALHNSINEMAYHALEEQGVHIIRYLKKSWADLCKCYLVEAKWYHSGFTPTLGEYFDNAWISISAPLILVHAYIFTANPITKEALKSLEEYPNIIRWSSMILRLANDLGTSPHEMKRGDVAKSIQCYMHETGASEEEARQHIRELITATWMKMNKDGLGSSEFSRTFIDIAMNIARMAQYLYQYGDGHGVGHLDTKDRVLSLLIDSIPYSKVKKARKVIYDQS